VASAETKQGDGGKMMYSLAPQLFLLKEKQVLLLLRTNTKTMDGYWGGITGHIEPGETPTAMLIRETEEEIGVILSDFVLNNCVEQKSPSYHDPSVPYFGLDIFFVSYSWQGEPYNKEPYKHGDLQWFNLDNIPNNTIPAVKEGIKNLIIGSSYTELRTSE
jgi:8-oxo-dGTP pyrophosphatase MutT (NUDIX family)